MEMLVMSELREQLDERKRRLQSAINSSGNVHNLVELLQSVDSALERIDNGSYGICNECHGAIENEWLSADPLVTVCLECLDEKQQRTLEEDISLASRIQRELLPPNDLKINGWEFCYHYAPAGAVSGDYIDIITTNPGDNSVLFSLGDVSGKGIAASLLMSHLHAMLRSLSAFDFPLSELMKRANRVFCESTPLSHYATLFSGRAGVNGELEISNAGHNYPLLISQTGIYQVKSTGLPIGMFHDSEYETEKIQMNKGDVLLLYTDGLTESSLDGVEYGEERLMALASKIYHLTPQEIIGECLSDLKNFLAGSLSTDDLTIMMIKRV
jgi:phosphoserine phosphatase RsbU/P